MVCDMKKQTFLTPGQTFNRLTVVGFVKTGKHYRRHFKFKCECGKEITVSAEAVISGNTKSCGCIRRDVTRKRYGLAPGVAAMRQLIAQSYRRRNGKEWHLSEDQFFAITQRTCRYCGEVPSRIKKSANGTGDFKYNGLDRVDSSRGYFLDNVVPCCRRCNIAKSDMSVKEFHSWILKISEMAEQWG